eukprot:CAMPEP_0113330970 /NCGR_PEP_ID=MMETSP0010_2-20120614/22133_1 /TAXON_ID=216773 ORGANISM="Corethron hystrix, Strain 308" /NCGR_SAMPLE_ID=MMETSP0010_2 /ASSEMBLY_ACC=CAM_ASM_000155 /LENGTH=81 /DNA_ID=CAMNT_0000193993 /DNA_START=107 /DNA_END=352 /DNA_ORIENTATION=+ /assembly_acc=CAM_ASM_000155
MDVVEEEIPAGNNQEKPEETAGGADEDDEGRLLWEDENGVAHSKWTRKLDKMGWKRKEPEKPLVLEVRQTPVKVRPLRRRE